MMSLHQFVGRVAMNYDVSIFADGALEELGIILPEGVTYDNIFAYRPIDQPSSNEKRSIVRELRVGDAHSRQCDIDHRLGRDYRHLHSILFAQPTNHRMNICFIHSRVNEGHWCCGLQVMRYRGGVESSEVELAPVLGNITFPSIEDIAQGSGFNGNDDDGNALV